MDSSGRRRPIIYCIVPEDLAARLHEPLRRHFVDRPDVEVVVEQRGSERRGQPERRTTSRPAGAQIERRRIRNLAGRRLGDRRAATLESAPPDLPRKARPHVAELVFVERIEPSSEHAEDLDSARLAARIQAGESELFAELYMRYFERIYNYVRVVLSGADDAEDATQQIFLKVLQALPRYEVRDVPFRAWLFVVARNPVLSQLRLARRGDVSYEDEIVDGDGADAEGAELGALSWISDGELQMFVERLPIAQRQVLFLRFAVGMSLGEVAATLGQSPETVRKQQSRALQFLRQRLTAVERGTARRRGDRIGSKILLRQAGVLRMRRFSLLLPE
jgi:RNA polymerase sigma-70 factor (ECF subfamily)